MLDIKVHTDQHCAGIEPAFLNSAEELIDSGLTSRSHKSCPNAKQREIYGSDSVVSRQKIVNEL